MMWCDQYKPAKIKDVCGHKMAIKKITSFLDKPKSKCLILTGMNGVGKTLLANLIPTELNYNVKNVDDIHDLKSLVNMSSFFQPDKKVCIVYEAIYVKNINTDITLMEHSTQPIIFVADTEELKKFTKLKKISTLIHLKPLTQSDIKPLLTKLNIKKCPPFDGDLRHLLLNLQMDSVGEKDIVRNHDEMLMDMFDYRKSVEEKFERFQDYRTVPRLIHINYLYTKIKPDEKMYEKVEKDIYTQSLKSEILKARKEGKEKGVKKIKIKKPKIEKDVINDAYKMEVVSSAIDGISDGDLVQKMLSEKQNYDLVPHLILNNIRGASCVSGKLNEYDVKYYIENSRRKFTLE